MSETKKEYTVKNLTHWDKVVYWTFGAAFNQALRSGGVIFSREITTTDWTKHYTQVDPNARQS